MTLQTTGRRHDGRLKVDRDRDVARHTKTTFLDLDICSFVLFELISVRFEDDDLDVLSSQRREEWNYVVFTRDVFSDKSRDQDSLITTKIRRCLVIHEFVFRSNFRQDRDDGSTKTRRVRCTTKHRVRTEKDPNSKESEWDVVRRRSNFCKKTLRIRRLWNSCYAPFLELINSLHGLSIVVHSYSFF